MIVFLQKVWRETIIAVPLRRTIKVVHYNRSIKPLKI